MTAKPITSEKPSLPKVGVVVQINFVNAYIPLVSQRVDLQEQNTKLECSKGYREGVKPNECIYIAAYMEA